MEHALNCHGEWALLFQTAPVLQVAAFYLRLARTKVSKFWNRRNS